MSSARTTLAWLLFVILGLLALAMLEKGNDDLRHYHYEETR